MCGALAHFYAPLVFQTASAKLYMQYAIFLRIRKKFSKKSEKNAFFHFCANTLRRNNITLWRKPKKDSDAS